MPTKKDINVTRNSLHPLEKTNGEGGRGELSIDLPIPKTKMVLFPYCTQFYWCIDNFTLLVF